MLKSLCHSLFLINIRFKTELRLAYLPPVFNTQNGIQSVVLSSGKHQARNPAGTSPSKPLNSEEYATVHGYRTPSAMLINNMHYMISDQPLIYPFQNRETRLYKQRHGGLEAKSLECSHVHVQTGWLTSYHLSNQIFINSKAELLLFLLFPYSV